MLTEYIYLWNTTENKTSRIDRDPHIVNMMYMPEMVTGGNNSPINDSELDHGEFNIQEPSGVPYLSTGKRNVNDRSAGLKRSGDTRSRLAYPKDPGWYFGLRGTKI